MASDAATDAAAKGKGAAKWLVNQFLPFGANGKLGRTIALTTLFAGVGACVALTGGAAAAALPFSTYISSSVSANAILAGTTTSATIKAAAVKAAADFTAASSFWSAVGTGAAEYGSHVLNGVSATFGTGVDIIKDGDWEKFGQAANDMGSALMPTGTDSP